MKKINVFISSVQNEFAEERLGTSMLDMIRLCREAGLNEPEFKREDVFKTIIRRSEQVTGQVKETIRRVVLVVTGDVKRAKIQEALGVKHSETFMENYLKLTIDEGFIEMTIPESPTSPNQRYHLTPKGKALVQKLKSKNI